LKDHPDLLATLLIIIGCYQLSIDTNFPLAGGNHAGQYLGERALAGSGFADQGQGFTRLQSKTDLFEGANRLLAKQPTAFNKTLANIGYAQQRLGIHFLASSILSGKWQLYC